MKIAIIGAAGVRTPLILQAIAARQERLGLTELALMDIDGERLELIAALARPQEQAGALGFKILRTTRLEQALEGADYVITTFRVGGSASRVVDERVPLAYGVLGQETTGPGGIAMGLRTIPVLLGVVAAMRRLCPSAWLINFANPAGMLAEAVQRAAGWRRAVGICDAPSAMQRFAAAMLKAPPQEVFLDYFGLNHLGWVRRVLYRGQDHLPFFIGLLAQTGALPELPFQPEFVAQLGLIPNEYLYYYYHRREAVENILRAGQTRGEQVLAASQELFASLARRSAAGDLPGMLQDYQVYLSGRESTYMQSETGGQRGKLDPALRQPLEHILAGEGYAGVALDLVEGLSGGGNRRMVLNVLNGGAVPAMAAEDVLEVPVEVQRDQVLPLAVGAVPDHCLGLMKQVKVVERLVIEAAVEGSDVKAWQALTLHPLVGDAALARAILDDYRRLHGETFPLLH